MKITRANPKDNSRRKFSGGGPRPDGNEAKREQAKKRNEDWAKLSPEQQLRALDSRPGESKKQRQRLLALIEARGSRPSQEPDQTKKSSTMKAKDRREGEKARRPSK